MNSTFNKSRVIIFGARETAKVIMNRIENSGLPIEIVAFVDNDKKLQGLTFFNKPVIAPKEIQSFEYEQIIISIKNSVFIKDVVKQLTEEYKVPLEYINTEFIHSMENKEARLSALKNVAKIIIEQKIEGEIAELGVYRGDFAQHINKVFPQRKLYLFDTFDGFSINDIKKDIEMGNSIKLMDQKYNFTDTSEEFVMSKMDHPENCIVKKGYFPTTLEDLDENFAFVSLDADLYVPMLEGLKYFYQHLNKGGYIFVHDFFSDFFCGTKKAVLEYNDMENIKYVPLGDNSSICIVK
jgi:O-methyltransferase